MADGGYTIKGVLFDFDGTLTQPGALDFKEIKAALECPLTLPVLEYIDTLSEASERQAVLKRLDHFEMQGAQIARPNQDAQQTVAWVKSRHLPTGIITRNSRASVLRALDNFGRLKADDFDMIITRDDPPAYKPSGQGIVWAARRWRIAPAEILIIGDYLFDLQAGSAAGAVTVLLDPQNDPRLAEVACDFRIAELAQLPPIIAAGLPLPTGKLPNRWLARYLKEFQFKDPSVLMPPGVGEDVTAVDMAAAEVLILKTDPITFATDAIGRYAVNVAANDIATAGATPRWMLSTLIMPPGTTPSKVRAVMQELYQNARQAGIAMCGGHTEISDAVQRPVVVAMMAGTVKRSALVEKKNMAEGDVVLLTKQVAVEGTAIIAREFEADLKEKGFTHHQLAQGKSFLDHISVLPEAQAAAHRQMATAMHDVTEGGLATAVAELSTAGGHRISIALEKIPISKLTRSFCAALNLDPLGLIGSGSLLICCRRQHCQALMAKIQNLGIAVTPIGQVQEAGTGVEALNNGEPASWPEFEVDEIARLCER